MAFRERAGSFKRVKRVCSWIGTKRPSNVPRTLRVFICVICKALSITRHYRALAKRSLLWVSLDVACASSDVCENGLHHVLEKSCGWIKIRKAGFSAEAIHGTTPIMDFLS